MQKSTPLIFSESILYSLAAVHHKAHGSLTHRLKSYGLQVEMWRIMEVLLTSPQMTMKELARLVLMNPPTLTKLVDRMVANGLVHRQAGVKDSREVYLILTDLGRKRHEDVSSIVQQQEQQIRDSIEKNEIATLQSILQKMI